MVKNMLKLTGLHVYFTGTATEQRRCSTYLHCALPTICRGSGVFQVGMGMSTEGCYCHVKVNYVLLCSTKKNTSFRNQSRGCQSNARHFQAFALLDWLVGLLAGWPQVSCKTEWQHNVVADKHVTAK